MAIEIVTPPTNFDKMQRAFEELPVHQRERIFNAAALHINSALTDLTFGVDQDSGYAHMEACPLVLEPKQHDRFYKWNRADMLRDDAVEGAAGSTVPIMNLRTSDSDYFAKEYHLAAIIKEEDRKNADPALSLEETVMKKLISAINIRKERLFAAACFATGKWNDDDTAAAVGGGGDTVQFDDYTNSTPVTYLKNKARTLARGIGKRRMDLIGVCNRGVMDTLEEHPTILGKYEFTREGILGDTEVAKALGIKKVVVSDVAYASSDPLSDATDSNTTVTKILDNHFLLMYPGEGKVGRMDPAGAKTFGWAMDGVNPETGFRVSTWDQFDLDVRGTVVLVQCWVDPKVTFGAAGVFVSSACSSSIA